MRSSNKIKIEDGMSSMTDLVFLLLIFFIILATKVDVNHDIELPKSKGEMSETSNIKIYVTKKNDFYINNIEENFKVNQIKTYIDENIGSNMVIELLADKNSERASVYEIIRLAKQKSLKVVIKTKTG